MRYQPPTAECLVYAFKEGVLSAVGHDLEIRVARFSVDIEEQQSEDGAASLRIEAKFDARSFQVVSAMVGGQPRALLADRDKRTIEGHLTDDVLEARRWPAVTFRGTASATGDSRRVEGTLALHGREQKLSFEARLDGDAWRAELPLNQPDYGIKPFSAMLGALKVKPGLRVKIAVPADSMTRAVPTDPATKIE